MGYRYTWQCRSLESQFAAPHAVDVEGELLNSKYITQLLFMQKACLNLAMEKSDTNEVHLIIHVLKA